jgi:hypothetical protein
MKFNRKDRRENPELSGRVGKECRKDGLLDYNISVVLLRVTFQKNVRSRFSWRRHMSGGNA